jgi:hypothetical protein
MPLGAANLRRDISCSHFAAVRSLAPAAAAAAPTDRPNPAPAPPTTSGCADTSERYRCNLIWGLRGGQGLGQLRVSKDPG